MTFCKVHETVVMSAYFLLENQHSPGFIRELVGYRYRYSPERRRNASIVASFVRN